MRLLSYTAQELDAGEDEKCTEYVEDPMKPGEQDGADEDQDRPHHERTEHAPLQDVSLQARRHTKSREHHEEHEDVVDRQRLLEDVAGEKFGSLREAER